MRWGWLNGRRPDGSPAVPFEVSCVCGHVFRGQRQARAQVLSCGQCNQPVFVLPASPLPAIDSDPSLSQPTLPTRSVWLWPVLATAVTMLFAGLMVLSVVTWLPRRSGPRKTDLGAVDSHLGLGRQALAASRYRLAQQHFQTALHLARQAAELPAATDRELRRLLRQAELLADLSTDSLQQILRHARGVPAEEWEAFFARHYRGKAVVLDVEVRWDAAGGVWKVLGLRLPVGDDPHAQAHIELGDFQLLRSVPASGTHRLLFGARLAAAGRRAGGGWGIRFEPLSGVFLTDIEAVVSCGLPTGDPQLEAILRQQRAWVEQSP
ncbi:MAG: hypothetical protein NZ700_05335 [Gemmataceae bacterium]|nr:hypothetical protein [Gemmataceae bacterium]MDW8265098.1 hypothetical protein [Gemmataceae bacterium]